MEKTTDNKASNGGGKTLLRERSWLEIMKVTPEVIASLTGGIVEGDKDREITGFAKIEEAKSGDISFIANKKYHHFASATEAAALLVGEDFEAPEGCGATLIKVRDPYASLAMLMGAFTQAKRKSGIEQPCQIAENAEIGEGAYVGAFAYISEGARIGKNAMIYPHAFIGENVEIGDDSIVYPNVTVCDGCRVGQRCILHSGCVIGADGFGFAPDGDEYKKIPQIGVVVLEDDVEVGANTTIDRATMGETRVCKGTKLDNLIQVAHNVRIGRNNVIAAQSGIAGSAKLGDSNRIGGQVGIAGHITFGNRCEIGAQSGIHRAYKDGSRVIGYPAIDIASFAKLQVLFRRLPELFTDVDTLKKKIQNPL